jgi:hypothetical protein
MDWTSRKDSTAFGMGIVNPASSMNSDELEPARELKMESAAELRDLT